MSGTYTAINVNTQERYGFHKISGLVRRLGGTGFQVEHDSSFGPGRRRVMILKPAPKQGDTAHAVVATVTVSSEALTQVDQEMWD